MVIGLIGYAGCGKDTVGAEIIRQTNHRFQRVAFADALKRDLDSVLYRCMGLDIKDPADKQKAREVLVAWGRLGRSLDPDHWIKRIGSFHGISVVVTDVRYSNEAKWIKQMGGMNFVIQRDGVGAANDEERRSIAEIMFHPSTKESRAAELFDFFVHNAEGKSNECAAEILSKVSILRGTAFEGIPQGSEKSNGGQKCDMARGPCSCGAWH